MLSSDATMFTVNKSLVTEVNRADLFLLFACTLQTLREREFKTAVREVPADQTAVVLEINGVFFF